MQLNRMYSFVLSYAYLNKYEHKFSDSTETDPAYAIGSVIQITRQINAPKWKTTNNKEKESKKLNID